MGANNPQESTQASRELLAYVRKMLGPSSLSSSAAGAPSVKLPITQSGTTGQEALTNGERANGSPRQLQAEAITRPSKSNSGSSGSISLGNNWLLPPIAGVLNSVLGLFGIGSSTSQVTRYRAETRQPFEVVQEISPETGAGVQTIDESASGLSGVTNGNSPTALSTSNVAAKGSGVPAPARLSAQVANRTIADSRPQGVNWMRRLTGGAISTGAPAAKAEESASSSESITPSNARVETRASGEGTATSTKWVRRLTGSAGSAGRAVKNSETWANGVVPPTGCEARSLMNDRQGLVSAVRRSLNDSRGFSDVLNEFQDGL